jgi:hypothetical protein
MAIRLVRRVSPDVRSADAESLGLRVERDGDRYQYFALVASDHEIRLDHGIEPGNEFDSSAVSVGAEQVRESLPHVVRLDEPRPPIGLPLDVERVARRLTSGVDLPSFVEGEIVDEWTE